MILYHCVECGKWQDVSLVQGLQKALIDGFFANASTEHKNALLDANVFECPSGHGPMTQVLPTDRIAIREKQSETEPHLKVVKPESEVNNE